MSTTKKVASIHIVYDDGTEATFAGLNGMHRQSVNYDKGAKLPEEGWQHHEIRWTERQSD